MEKEIGSGRGISELGITADIVQKIPKRLRYFGGHMTRMKASRLPNIALLGHANEKRERAKKKMEGQFTCI